MRKEKTHKSNSNEIAAHGLQIHSTKIFMAEPCVLGNVQCWRLTEVVRCHMGETYRRRILSLLWSLGEFLFLEFGRRDLSSRDFNTDMRRHLAQRRPCTQAHRAAGSSQTSRHKTRPNGRHRHSGSSATLVDAKPNEPAVRDIFEAVVRAIRSNMKRAKQRSSTNILHNIITACPRPTIRILSFLGKTIAVVMPTKRLRSP